MTEYQGYPTKAAHDIAVISAAVAEMTDLSSKPITFAKNVEIKWHDPSPISNPLDDLMRMRDLLAGRRTFGERHYSNAWVTRYMAGMEPPRDSSIVDAFTV